MTLLVVLPRVVRAGVRKAAVGFRQDVQPELQPEAVQRRPRRGAQGGSLPRLTRAAFFCYSAAIFDTRNKKYYTRSKKYYTVNQCLSKAF